MKYVLQGDTASPSLLNFFMERIVEKLEKKSNIYGFKLPTLILIVHILLYTDNMAMVAAFKETLQLKIDVAGKFLRQRGLNNIIENPK